MNFHTHPTTDTIAAFLASLAGQDDTTRTAMVEAAVIATGGTWVAPPAGANWPASHLCEISLFGLLGRGTTAADAITDWMKAATRVAGQEAA